MRVPRAFCLLLLMSVVPTQTFAQEPTAKDILASLDKNAKTFSSLETAIDRVQVVRDFKHPAESGKLYIKMANGDPRIFLDIEKPKALRKSVLIDKGKGTLYMPETNTYMDSSVDPKSDVLQYLLMGFGTSSATMTKGYNATYKGTEPLNGVRTAILELTPISKVTEKYTIRLWLDPATWTPVQTRLLETERSYMDFKYSSVRVNKGVSDSVFKSNVPKGAKKQ